MPSMRDIQRRIKSVKNTQQITKAMKMVAAAKLRKAQELAVASRPYSTTLKEVLERLAGAADDVAHPLLEKREEIKKVGYVMITGDRGLCGAYNNGINRKVRDEIKQFQNVSLVTVGRKGRDFFKRLGTPIVAEYIGISDHVSFEEAQDVAQAVVDFYVNGDFDEIYLVYTQFKSALSYVPTTVKLLPIETPAGDKEETNDNYLFEPNPQEILNTLLPKYVETLVYNALLNSKASELGARMTAMGSATDNAKEMIAKLVLSFNRARQAAITKELSEIVGGAAALE